MKTPSELARADLVKATLRSTRAFILAIFFSMLFLKAGTASPADTAEQAMFNHDSCQEACQLDRDAQADMQAGNYIAAIEKLKLAVVLHPNLYSAENNLALAYENLAISQRRQNDLANAEENYLESYRRMQQNFKKDNRELAAVCDGLAETEEMLGKFRDAQVFRVRSIELNEKIYGKAAICVIQRKLAYALCLRKCGDAVKAGQIEAEVKKMPRCASPGTPAAASPKSKPAAVPPATANSRPLLESALH